MNPKDDSKKQIAKEAIKEVLHDDSTKQFEVIFRDGPAAAIVPEIKDVDVELTGTIDSVSEFYTKRPQQFAEDRAHIVYSTNPDNLFIKLKTNEHKERPHYVITGKIEKSDELKDFGIAYKAGQLPTKYDVKKLVQLLRFNKRLFANADQCNKVIEGMMRFRASITSVVTKIDSERGNKSGSYDIQVDTSIPMNFDLSMPIFKGKPTKQFNVQICFEVKSATEIDLWLESPELSTIISDTASLYINEELTKLSTLVQIEQ